MRDDDPNSRQTEEELRSLRQQVDELAGQLADQKQRNERQRRRVQRYRRLYEDAPHAYFSVGVDGKIRSLNRRAEEMLGYPKEQLFGVDVSMLYADTPDGKERAAAAFRRFIAGEDIDDEELQMRRANGELMWISLSVRANRDDQGNIIDSRSAILDIDARKDAEEALQDANDELERWAIRRARQLASTTEELQHSRVSYREIFNSATDMIVVQDLETGEILDVNAEYTRATGFSADELREKGVAAFSPPGDQYAPEKAMQYVARAAQGHPQLFEWAYLSKSGRLRHTEVHLKRVMLGGQPRLLGIVRDITKRRRAEEYRQSLEG